MCKEVRNASVIGSEGVLTLIQTLKSRPKFKKKIQELGCPIITDLSLQLDVPSVKNKKLDGFNRYINNKRNKTQQTVKAPPSLISQSQRKQVFSKSSTQNSNHQQKTTVTEISEIEMVKQYILLKHGINPVEYKVPGDGNCLYHCLYFLYQKYNLKVFGEVIRYTATIQLKNAIIRSHLKRF